MGAGVAVMPTLRVYAGSIHAGSPPGRTPGGVHARKRQRILMNILIFGPNGSGKGTQGALLMEKYGIQHIESGAVFRQHIGNGTELGKKAKAYIDKGELVPDDITIPMVLDILEAQGDKGWLLDGFPRNMEQARKLEDALEKEGLKLDYVVEIRTRPPSTSATTSTTTTRTAPWPRPTISRIWPPRA